MDKEIAAILNQDGFVAARGCAFKDENVWLLRTRWGIPTVKINGVGANPMRWPEGSARRVFRCRFPSAARSGQGMKRAELMTICRSVSPLALSRRVFPLGKLSGASPSVRVHKELQC
jgi:hypothetical protein